MFQFRLTLGYLIIVIFPVYKKKKLSGAVCIDPCKLHSNPKSSCKISRNFGSKVETVWFPPESLYQNLLFPTWVNFVCVHWGMNKCWNWFWIIYPHVGNAICTSVNDRSQEDDRFVTSLILKSVGVFPRFS